MFIKSVREAFETSVTCSFLFVRCFKGCSEGLAVRGIETYIDDPRFDCTKEEIIFLVSFAYNLMVVN